MARRAAATEIEVYPEVDRLDGFPHPRETRQLFGHLPAQQELSTALDGGRIHHAWLVTGPEGVGKATLAYKFAAYALSPEAARSADTGMLACDPGGTAARQVKTLSHPGLLVIRRSYDIKNKRFPATIPVDDVRRLRGFLGHKAGDRAWRVVIVDSADELNLNAANALLKSLEEPPTRTIFLLIATEPGRLLATIRSRCRLLALQPLPREDAVAAAQQALADSELASIGDDELAAVASAAGGSVRRLLALTSANGVALADAVDKIFNGLARGDWAANHALADRLAPAAAQQSYDMFLTLLLEKLARLIKVRAGWPGGEVDGKLVMQLIPDGGLATWVELWETLQRERVEIQALNLDRSAFIVDALARIQATAAQAKRAQGG